MRKSAFYLSLFFISLLGCNQPDPSSATEPTTDSVSETKADTAIDRFVYDPALEPLTVGAQLSKKLGDTLNIKMYEFTIKPGDSAALHAHPDHIVYVVQGGKALISINGAPATEWELKTGDGFISGPVKDFGKNIGKTTIKLVVADIYRPLK